MSIESVFERYEVKYSMTTILLSYRREAFLGKEDSDFRMTFDEDILFRDYDLSLQGGIYGATYQ
ncbi:MAG TPA: polyphosphate polymerase domain-containing protein [Epulopiscium sp.]|nr:polyphosphate polymerase domain-containing protein [Candidatus Epulonipiscium sp.]